MKQFLKVLPFLAVLVILLGSVCAARFIHSKPNDVYPVNTAPDPHGTIHLIRLFESVSSVMVIDRDNHIKKRKIPTGEYTYDPKTTELILKNPLPFKNSVVHVEGKASQPESFCVYDFEGNADDLLVALGEREAIEGYEYSFDKATRTITFRRDIHPERDGLYLIMYETADGATHSFGNFTKKNKDAFATLQWQWLHKTRGAPMLVMKDRSTISNRRLRKETGFFVDLPKGNATFITEKMEGTEKVLSVMRWYDDTNLMVECKATPFIPSDEVQAADEMIITRFGKNSVTKQRIIGTRTDADGTQSPVPLIVYAWQAAGTFYQLTAEEQQESDAEQLLGRL